jgi:cell shape-determining protein MreC
LISQNELEVEERQVKKLIGEITHQKLEAQKIIEEQEELKQLQNMQRKSVTGDSINLQKDKKKAN